MEFETVRLILAIQAMIAGDPAPLAAYQDESAEYREIVIVEPAAVAYWPMHGEVVSHDLRAWSEALSQREGARAYLSLKRIPRFLERPYNIIEDVVGYGPEYVSAIMCVETVAERNAYWISDKWVLDQRRLSLWKLEEWPEDCAPTGPGAEEATLALGNALNLLIEYTSEVFGDDSIWIRDYLTPHLNLLGTDGASRTAFQEMLVPGQRRMLLEAAFGLGIFGGMGSWSDHYPPEGYEEQQQEALEAWFTATEMALMSAVNVESSE